MPSRRPGVPVIDRPGFDTLVRSLDRLLDGDGQLLTPQSHAGCPGHAAYLDDGWDYLHPDTGVPIDSHALDARDANDLDPDDPDADPTPPVYDGPEPVWGAHTYPVHVCTDPTGYGHQPRYAALDRDRTSAAGELTDEEREARRAERRDVIESNKAWSAATTVRTDWLRSFAARKTAPKGSAAFVAAAIARDAHLFDRIGGNTLAADLLGRKAENYGRSHELVELIDAAGESHGWQLTLIQTLAAYEDATSRDDWRHVRSTTRRYLTFLAAQGYTLAGVERRACGDPATAEDGGTQSG